MRRTDSDILRDLWAARQERSARRREWAAITALAAEQYGYECSRSPRSPDDGGPCWVARIDRAIWCPRCAAPHDAWVTYRKAASRAAGALRAALAAGKRVTNSQQEAGDGMR